MLLISSSYFKTKCTRALHIVYPDEKKSLTVNNGIKNIICQSHQVLVAGIDNYNDDRWNEFDLIMVHGNNNTKIKDYLHRLMRYKAQLQRTANDNNKFLIFVDNTASIVSEKVLLMPRGGNLFINDIAQSNNIDIESEGLGLTKDQFDCDFNPKDVTDKYFRCLTYASMKNKIYMLSPDGIFSVNGKTHLIRGTIYLLHQNKMKQLSGDDVIDAEVVKGDLTIKKGIRPIRAIYKETEMDNLDNMMKEIKHDQLSGNNS